MSIKGGNVRWMFGSHHVYNVFEGGSTLTKCCITLSKSSLWPWRWWYRKPLKKNNGFILTYAHRCTCLIVAATLLKINLNDESTDQSMHGWRRTISRISVERNKCIFLHRFSPSPLKPVLILHWLDQLRKDAKWRETTWDPLRLSAQTEQVNTVRLASSFYLLRENHQNQLNTHKYCII